MLVRFLISAIVGLLSYAVLNSLRQKGVCSSVRLGSFEAEGDYGEGGFSPLDVEIDRNNARSTFLFLSYVPSVATMVGTLAVIFDKSDRRPTPRCLTNVQISRERNPQADDIRGYTERIAFVNHAAVCCQAARDFTTATQQERIQENETHSIERHRRPCPTPA